MSRTTHHTASHRAEIIGKCCGALVGVGGALVAANSVGLRLPPCPFRLITGLPCPGCGITRIATTVAEGNVSLALGTDAAAVGLLGALAIGAALYLIAISTRRPIPSWVGSLPVMLALMTLAGGHWLNTLVHGVGP